MKAKCPFCKQSYDFTDDNIFEYDGKKLQCANCNEEFTLREVLPCIEEYKEMVTSLKEKQKELLDTKAELAAEKKNLKKYKREDDCDYDELHADYFPGTREEHEENIKDLEDYIKDLKQQIDDTKDEYLGAKEDLPKKSEVNNLYAVEMYGLFENGLLKSPLFKKEKEKVKRLISMGNCGYLLEIIIIDSSLRYCLIDELQAICEKLAHDRYLPLPPREYMADGSISPKQLELLVSFGLNIDEIKQLSKESASWLISTILNKHDEARFEWLRLFMNSEDKTALLSNIEEFYNASVIVPPPKE